MKKLTREDMKNLVGGFAHDSLENETCNCNSADDCSKGQICGADCTAGTSGKAGHCTTQ